MELFFLLRAVRGTILVYLGMSYEVIGGVYYRWIFGYRDRERFRDG